MSDFHPALSSVGEKRRGQILDLALAEARRRRRRRVTSQAALAAMAGLLVAVLIPPLLRIHRAPDHPITLKNLQPAPSTSPPPPTLVTRIETDPHILERLAIPPHPSHVTLITDGELLDGLATAHRPAALAYVNGKATLLFH
jgi:hypothetical protein